MAIEHENDRDFEGLGLQAEDTTKDKYLTFDVSGETYGIEIVHIKEIISICAITLVPHTPSYVKGIINLRGDIIPVIDVRERFIMPNKEYDELTCIVVIEHENYILGLIVDGVKEVAYIDEGKVAQPPSAKLRFQNQFIKNIGRYGEVVVLLMDLDKVLME